MIIPYGSCVSWRIPPELNGFFEKVFGWLQNKITGEPETHCSMTMSEYPEVNAYYEYELSVTGRISIFHIGEYNTVYDILAPVNMKAAALTLLINNTKGDFYGFLQTTIFLVRFIIEKFGGDGRRIWNPFPWLGICSEGMYSYLYRLGRLMDWKDLTDFMDQWSPDVFHSGDARVVLDFMVEKGYARKIWN